jgi:hypothetical protein
MAVSAFQFPALLLLYGAIGRWSALALAILVALILLIGAAVLLPAVWSGKSFRRKAALDVLELFSRAFELRLDRPGERG